MIQKFSVGETL